MRDCGALLKAIDAYIAKVDDDLSETLNEAGFADCADTVAAMSELEDNIARALTAETRYINQRLRESVDLAEFADNWEEIKETDDTGDVLAELFYNSFTTNMPKLATSYIKRIDSALTVSQITRRTVDWAQSWSAKLGKIMKLTTHERIENLLIENLREGKSVADFTRDLIDAGIRGKREEEKEDGTIIIIDEYHRARTTAVTEMLRAHSVAQQEAITQNPAVEDKMWVHTGGHRNKPRQNHVNMDGVIVRKDQPFSLTGADGNEYYPMYPRDPELPAGESINCHCIHQGIASEDALGLSLEERKRLQQQAIDEDDGLWEREIDVQNRARAGIDSENSLTNPADSGIIDIGGENMQDYKVDTGGLRNDMPLTQQQIDESMEYAIKLGLPREQILYSNALNVSYGSNFDILYLGTDTYPAENIVHGTANANSRISWRGSIAHEIVGHREAALKGWTQKNQLFEETQASIRAARFAPDLSLSERTTLLRDAVYRLNKDGFSIREVRELLNITER